MIKVYYRIQWSSGYIIDMNLNQTFSICLQKIKQFQKGFVMGFTSDINNTVTLKGLGAAKISMLHKLNWETALH